MKELNAVLICIREALLLLLDGLRAACLDFCVQSWSIVKHNESGAENLNGVLRELGCLPCVRLVCSSSVSVTKVWELCF